MIALGKPPRFNGEYSTLRGLHSASLRRQQNVKPSPGLIPPLKKGVFKKVVWSTKAKSYEISLLAQESFTPS
eukprot:4288514-Amphidinium_carterae.1